MEERRSSAFEVGRIGFDKLLFVLRDIVDGKDRIRGAGGNTRAAVDALRWVNKKLFRFLETGLILLGVNAVGGTNIDTEGILDAGVGNYIGHDESLQKSKWV